MTRKHLFLSLALVVPWFALATLAFVFLWGGFPTPAGDPDYNAFGWVLGEKAPRGSFRAHGCVLKEDRPLTRICTSAPAPPGPWVEKYIVYTLPDGRVTAVTATRVFEGDSTCGQLHSSLRRLKSDLRGFYGNPDFAQESFTSSAICGGRPHEGTATWLLNPEVTVLAMGMPFTPETVLSLGYSHYSLEGERGALLEEREAKGLR